MGSEAVRVGLVGARGYTGRELVALLEGHPQLTLSHAFSRRLAGDPVPGAEHVLHDLSDPDIVAGRACDAIVLAMPNGAAAPYVEALEGSSTPPRVILDLSADYRFDDDWVYGLPEHDDSGSLVGARRISNPGCFATALQLAVRPIRDRIDGSAHCFGVSGYSGAGTTPSEKNDLDVLRDTVLPYALSGHIHEREASRHLGCRIRFTPSVAPFFRGIVLTVQADLTGPCSDDELQAAFTRAYSDAPLVDVVGTQVPRAPDVAGTAKAIVGGLATFDDQSRVSVVSALDNLGKGAATQAIQNLNLSLGFEPLAGLGAVEAVVTGA